MGRAIWKGKLILECTGSDIASFLDQAVQDRLHIENVRWLDEHKMEFYLGLSDFFSLREIAKKHAIRITIKKKIGLVFLWKKIKRKKAFFIGFVLFTFLLLIMSSLVWSVEISSGDKVSLNRVHQVLKQQGVFKGQLKFLLPRSTDIQHEMLAQFPELSWAGFRIEGTKVVVTLVEKKRPEIHKPDFPSQGPVHLIATKSALIKDVRAEKGNPLVEVNDMVKEGQVLISGVYGDMASGPVVGARGKVMGEVWYESSITVPTTTEHRVFTGERENSVYPYIGGVTLYNPFKSDPFSTYETIKHYHAIYVGGFKLPFGWVEEEYMESETVTQKLNFRDAIELGLTLTRKNLNNSIGREGFIEKEQVLQSQLKDDKVYLKVHFDVIENIGAPLPILQGEDPIEKN